VAAEGKPRGTWQYRKERGLDLYRLALARKMGSAGADQDLQSASGSNKAVNKVRTSHLHLWAQALPRGVALTGAEKCLYTGTSIRGRARVRWLSLPISQVGRACEHSSSEGRSMSAPGSRVLDVQVR
jgi:hypothetical protein